MEKTYQLLAVAIDARRNCMNNNNEEWFSRWSDRIDFIQDEILPSGSGIDSGNKIDLEKSNDQKIIINSSFHSMDENGYYDGWIDYSVTIKPSLSCGFYLEIQGNFGKKQDIKEYLQDIYHCALSADIKEKWDKI